MLAVTGRLHTPAVGYRGKVVEQEQARALRAEAWTLQDIALELGVAKSTVSLWVRDVAFEPNPRRTSRRRAPNRLQVAKQSQIDTAQLAGRQRIAALTEQEFLVAGAALYAGEGAKTDGDVKLANCDDRIIAFHCQWLRRFFDIDESRLRVTLYLHQGLDLDAANRHWTNVTNIPLEQFNKPYRAVPDPSIRRAKHEFGCPAVSYRSVEVHRLVLGLVQALLSCAPLPSGVAQLAERLTVNQNVVGSSPTPGASISST